MQTSDFPSQSLLHHQHSNAHPPVLQKSIFNLLDLTSLHAPLPLPPLKLSLSVSPALKENRPGIPLDSRGSPHYELADLLFVSPICAKQQQLCPECNGSLICI